MTQHQDLSTGRREKLHEAQHEDHGNTPAAWTSTMILLVAAALLCLAWAADLDWAWIAGGVLVVVGLLAGIVLKAAGLGKKKPESSRAGGSTAVRVRP